MGGQEGEREKTAAAAAELCNEWGGRSGAYQSNRYHLEDFFFCNATSIQSAEANEALGSLHVRAGIVRPCLADS